MAYILVTLFILLNKTTMTEQEIIEETVEYYRNNPFGYDPHRDGDDNGGCVYYGPNAEVCAVGRCLINPEHFKDSTCGVTGLSLNVNNIVKEQYTGHDINFWQHLQFFHDDCANDLFKLEDYKNHKYLKRYYA